MSDPVAERRFKIVSVDPEAIVDLLNWWRDPPSVIALPQVDQLPKDTTVVCVHSNWERGTLDFMIASSEFSRVLPGAVPERFMGTGTEWRCFPFSELVAVVQDPDSTGVNPVGE